MYKLCIKSLNRFKVVYRVLLIGFVALMATGCATDPKPVSLIVNETHQEVLAYESSLAPDHPHRIQNMFVLSEEIKNDIRQRFNKGGKHFRAHQLADWLIAPDGHGMIYDLDANLSPIASFKQKRGNCLSFTILLVTLANELDIELKYNDVDLPNMWDMDEEAGLVFYRHVNAIFESAVQKQVFDLAMEEYDTGYPQRTFSERSAGALLHSNLGIQAIKEQNYSGAFHHLKLAVSIDPQRADLWINLGAAYKRDGQLKKAEEAFKIALNLNDRNSLAASNLERLYREQERHALADRYEKLAAKARLKNPYIHYNNAKNEYRDKRYMAAKKSIRRAIKLHDSDASFFELSSVINQQFKRYRSALKDLEKAFYLTQDAEDKGRYYRKVKMVAKRIEKLAEQRRTKQRGNLNDLEITPSAIRTF